MIHASRVSHEENSAGHCTILRDVGVNATAAELINASAAIIQQVSNLDCQVEVRKVSVVAL